MYAIWRRRKNSDRNKRGRGVSADVWIEELRERRSLQDEERKKRGQEFRLLFLDVQIYFYNQISISIYIYSMVFVALVSEGNSKIYIMKYFH